MLTAPAKASEVAEDYLDIASSYVVSGNYAVALDYLNKILMLEPNNRDIISLRNGLRRFQSGNSTSYATSNNPKLQQAENFKKNGDKSKEFESLTSAASGGGYWGNMFLGGFYKNSGEYAKSCSLLQKSVRKCAKVLRTSFNAWDLLFSYEELQRGAAYLDAVYRIQSAGKLCLCNACKIVF